MGCLVGGARGRDLGFTAPTLVDPGVARARHNLTDSSAGLPDVAALDPSRSDQRGSDSCRLLSAPR